MSFLGRRQDVEEAGMSTPSTVSSNLESRLAGIEASLHTIASSLPADTPQQQTIDSEDESDHLFDYNTEKRSLWNILNPFSYFVKVSEQKVALKISRAGNVIRHPFRYKLGLAERGLENLSSIIPDQEDKPQEGLLQRMGKYFTGRPKLHKKGWYMLMPWRTYTLVSTKEFSIDPDPINVITNDGQDVSLEMIYWFKVDVKDGDKVFRAAYGVSGGMYNSLSSMTKLVTSRIAKEYTLKEFENKSSREDIYKRIGEIFEERGILGQHGVSYVSSGIQDIRPPPEVQEARTAAHKAGYDAERLKILAGADAQGIEARGEAESKALKKLIETIKDGVPRSQIGVTLGIIAAKGDYTIGRLAEGAYSTRAGGTPPPPGPSS